MKGCSILAATERYMHSGTSQLVVKVVDELAVGVRGYHYCWTAPHQVKVVCLPLDFEVQLLQERCSCLLVCPISLLGQLFLHRLLRLAVLGQKSHTGFYC